MTSALHERIHVAMATGRAIQAQRRAAAVLLSRCISPTVCAWARAVIEEQRTGPYPLLHRLVGYHS
jgi:hypothetical protein